MPLQQENKPWYRQFWAWVVIGLPLIAVLASIHLVNLAHKDADDLVVDNYYKEGKGINRVLDQDLKASDLAMAAALSFNFAAGELRLSLDGNAELPSQLELKLLHPIEADQDLRILLDHKGAGQYVAPLAAKLQFRYHIRLQPADNPQWRLSGEIDFGHTSEATLIAR